ncbi:hypothetical protein HRI_002563300 [Hibiscus trionum]|uniref:RNase H type-1 domain-containing protein n=1 Tax=Hibiscus trionum TaxID=183268 RepID=A0A9W7M828_HIBTR|nr:hypothetical protein HRI_002563300 [Hibiscus trionum]
MQSTWLPKGLCNELERLIRRFVWGASNSTSAVPLVKWEVVQQPVDCGGLGFHDVGKQNSAFLMKLGFQLVRDDDRLWVKILKAKYRWFGVMPLHLRRTRCSRVWKGLSNVWDEVRRGICWNVRNGLLTDFWHDTWLDGEGPLAASCLNPHVMSPTPVVGMVTITGEWDWQSLAQLLPERVLLKMAAVPPPNAHLGDDNPAWRWETSRCFSTKSAYQALLPRQGGADMSVWKVIWSLNVPKRVQTFLWLMAHERLLTNVERVRRHIATSPLWSLCGVAEEDIDHVLRKCKRAEETWMNLVHVQDRNIFRMAPFREWMLGNLASSAVGMQYNEPWGVVFATTCWLLWKDRCSRIFDANYVGKQNMDVQCKLLAVEFAQACCSKQRRQREERPAINWSCPPPDWIKANTDGAAKLSSGRASVGGVLRSSAGLWILGFFRKVGSCTALISELWGIHDVLIHAWRLGFRRVEVESDSLEAIRIVTKASVVLHGHGLVAAILLMLDWDCEIRFRHIRRDGNMIADALASLGQRATVQ